MDMRELQHIKKGSIKQVRSLLMHKGYDSAYGSYSLDEVKQAIQDNQPVFMDMRTATLLAVGESEKGLYFQSGTKHVPVNNTQLDKAWSGKAVIVLGKEEPRRDFLIYLPEFDTWSPEYAGLKQQIKALLYKLQTGVSYLPDHPVIVYFKAGDTGKRIESDGITITVYFPNIAVIDDIIQAIGAIMWKKLTAEEQTWCNERVMQNSVASPLYNSISTGYDYFRALYTWYVKGEIIDVGFKSIIESHDYYGLQFLEGIFKRITEERRVKRAWPENEKILSEWLEEPKTYRVGNTLVKALNTTRKPIAHIRIPHGIGTILEENIFTFDKGTLQGKSVVLSKNGTVDLQKTRLFKEHKPSTKDKKIKQEIYPQEDVQTKKIPESVLHKVRETFQNWLRKKIVLGG